MLECFAQSGYASIEMACSIAERANAKLHRAMCNDCSDPCCLAASTWQMYFIQFDSELFAAVATSDSIVMRTYKTDPTLSGLS